ncbi:MAG TPA: ABC transporter ATP-binding protein [Bacteroidales bacterium]|nr:ABC transporter ATP-binding protein [Bacteroidales bacterium]
MSISISNISFSYSKNQVLKNLSIDIRQGEFIVLAGPNGSGKSTLIKCINGILQPQSGQIKISNANIRLYPKNKLAEKLAYVPQNKSVLPNLSVFDTIMLGRKPYINWRPSTKDLAITSQIIEQLQLESISMSSINELSGGQQQIVFIGRALAQQPDIILLDEPTAHLDIKHTVEIMKLLKTLSAKGLTIIVALHDINTAIRFADRILMLRDGEVFASGGNEIITEKNLEKLYDVKVRILQEENSFHVIPLEPIEK